MKEFVIPFFGLKTGEHNFEFSIDQAFFEAFESDLQGDADFEGKLRLDKTDTMLQLHFSVQGSLSTLCDRCGDPLLLPFSASDKLIVKFGDEAYEQTDELVVLTHDTHELDVSQYFYELIVLHLPARRVHADIAACNQQVIEELNRYQKLQQDHTDPRWDALKNLKD